MTEGCYGHIAYNFSGCIMKTENKSSQTGRRKFLSKALTSSVLCCFYTPGQESQDSPVAGEKKFIENWLSDLMATIDSELDEATKIKLMDGCGRGCFRRHQFKRDIAEEGKGDIEKLLNAMKRNFEIWREGNDVHIRYGEISNICYCPVLHDYPYSPNDLHCYCTRATHQAIFEEALGKPVRVDIVETLRRGGKTCHFIAHVT